MQNFKALVVASRERLCQARLVADEVGPESYLHELAMKTVFVLEDCHEMLVRLAQEKNEPAPLATE